jgi:WD40 repeat protein
MAFWMTGGLEFSENGALIFYTGYDSIDLREINNGQMVTTFVAANSPRPSCLHLHPNGRFLAAGYYDHEIRLWDVEHRRLVRAFKGFGVRIEDVKFTREGIVAIAQNGTIKVWKSRLREICDRPIGQSSLYDLFWLQKRLKRCKTRDEYAWTRFAEALLQPKFRYEVEIGDWNVPTADRYDIDLE